MKLQDQVCSAAQAKRLKELGIVQDALFFWYDLRGHHEILYKNDQDTLAKTYGMTIGAAFTVGEIGMMLPDDVRSYRIEGCWCIYYPDDDGAMNLFIPEDDETEALSRAAFLIWGLESGVITINPL